jgi:hypothetical protein
MRRSKRLGLVLALAVAGTVTLGGAPAGTTGLAAAPAAVPASEVAYGTVDADGGGCRLATIDLTTGVVTPFGPGSTNHCVWDLAVSPDVASLYGVHVTVGQPLADPGADGQATTSNTANLIRFDRATGEATDLGVIGAFPLGIGGPGELQGTITFDNAGRLFVQIVPNGAPCNNSAFCLYQVDPANPANATFFGIPDLGIVYAGLTRSCGGTYYTGRPERSGPGLTMALQTIDLSSSAVATVGTWTDAFVQSIDCDGAGVLHGIAGEGLLTGADAVTPDAAEATPSWGDVQATLTAPADHLVTLDRTTAALTAGPAFTTAGAPATVQAFVIVPIPEIVPTFTG